ncbi:MAG: hypothetical protein GXP42_19550 [Chloroflexi bacterium]|nr:hypothetical protein [Chloroflexota bacterium]
MNPALLALILVPIITHRWARRGRAQRVWLLTGIAFGLVVAPFALALYTTSYLASYLPAGLRSLGFILGFPGFILTRVHEAPAMILVSWFDMTVPANRMSYIFLEAINGVVWAAIYGGLGWALDQRRARI